MMLTIRPLLRLLRISAGRYFIVLMALAIAACFHAVAVNAQGYTNSFLYSFNPAVSKISFTPATRQGLFGESDTITISTSDNSPIRVMAIDGTLVYSGTPTALQLARGHYFVECNGDRSQFVVLPSDYQGASFLGVDAADGTDSVYTQRLAQIQPTWVRALTEGQWPVVEPSPGVWNWSTLDQTVAASAGRKIVVTAFIRPGWVTNNFLPQFLTYVTAMAQRYNGRIYAIQIWNEPWYSTVTANGLAWGDIGNAYTGNPAVDLPVFYQTLATLISSSRAAIQGVSPSMQVVGPDWQSPEDCNMTQPVMSLLGSQPMNIFSFHANTWTSPDGLTSSGSNGFAELTDLFLPYIGTLPWIVSEFHPFGTSALGIPTSGAEPGVPSPGFDWRRGMDRLTKTVVMWRAAGAQAIMPQVLPICAATLTNNWEDYGVEYGPGSYGRGPHPKTSAYLMSGYWLNNATFVDSRTPGQQVYLYAWKQPDNSSLVFAWTTEGITAPLLSTSSFNTLNLFGKTTQITALSEDPTLFTSTTLSPSALMDSILAALTQNYSVPPVWQPVNSQSVQIGQSLQFSVSAIDSNNAPITYSATGLPAGATLDPISGTFTWTPTSGQIGSYQVNFTATDDQGRSASTSTTIYVVGNLLDGLTHYWKFDEASGTNTADSVGQANGVLQNFSFSSPYGWVPGIEGTALSFNGAGASVLLPLDSVSLTNNFTLAAWVLPRNATGDTSFLSIQCNYRIGGLRLFIANNSLQVQGQTPAGWQGNVFATNAIQNGVWSHVIVVYDKSTVLVYLNGVYQGSAAWGGDLVMDPTGYTQFGTQGSYYFDGSLDDIMLFSRPLGPQEALDLYEAPLLPPTFSPITTQTVEPGQTVAFTLSATDVSGNQMTYSALSLPAGASFTASTQGFTWTPTSGQLGNSTATFVASDGWLTTTQQVLISVTSVAQSLTPTITSLKLTGSNAVISFTTVSSVVTSELYEVDYRNDLKAGTWLILTNGIHGTGGTLSITDSGAAGQSKRFYRVGGHF
jgi:hypothetical protein